VLFERGYHDRRLTAERIASVTAAFPATRFGFARKGRVAAGYDADLVLMDPHTSFRLDAAHLLQRHKASPYIGETFRGTVRRTIRRGETIFCDGAITATTRGQFVRPEPPLV
jgi:allantoinase